MDTRTAQAMIRFGLGRRGAEPLPGDPDAWLAGQLVRPDPALSLPGASVADGLAAIRADRLTPAPPGERSRVGLLYRAESEAMLNQVLESDTPFRERLVWFWFNHFTVSLRRGQVAAVVGSYLREAIRPHVSGRFGDMLLAVMRHPAMLLYLDNAQSVGPDSPAGRQQRRGLNENLARECLELHTVTPAAGYTQADVTEFARILTGWSISEVPPTIGFLFRPRAHQPGGKTLMGRVYPEGQEGGVQALAWLAQHPATHRNLAFKLARHFVADTPPPEAVNRLNAVLRDTQGDLHAVSLELTRLQAAWQPLTKLRGPADYVVAALRAIDLPADRRPPNPGGIMAVLGQPLLAAPLPNGWPDTADAWTGPEAMMRRIDWAYGVSGRAGRVDPAEVAENSLGPLLPAETLEIVRRAGSRRDGMTLLLTSPEFMRR